MSSQNLVKNPSFENQTKIDEKKLGKPNDWTLLIGGAIKGSPLICDASYVDYNYKFWFYEYKNDHSKNWYIGYSDFSNIAKDTANMVKWAWAWNVKPIEGNCCIKNTSSSKTLFQTKLKEALVKDELYYFEVYYASDNNNGHNVVKNLLELQKTGNFGVYFTNLDYSKEPLIDKLKNPSSPYRLSFTIKSKYLKNEGWNKFSVVIKANSNYKYMIIGNHNNLNNIDWYIDNITLVRFDEYMENIAVKGKSIAIPNINFKTNSSVINPQSFSTLDILCQYLKNKPELKIEISGHTDNVGTESQNMGLSERRAKSVVDYFINKGISKNRLSYKGYGNTKAVASNKTESGRKQNRRVEIKIL